MSAHQQQQQQQRYHLGTPSSVLAPSPLLTQTAITRRVTNSQPYDSGSSENSSQSEESPTLSTPMFPAHRERVGPRVRGNVSTRNPPQSSNHTARPSQTSPSFGRVGPAPNEKSVPSRYPQAKPSHIVHQQGMHGEKSSSSSHHSTHLYYAAPNMSIWQSLEPEDDDWMHNPDPKRDRKEDKRIGACSARGVCDVGTMIVIMLACLALFAGYPVAVMLLRTFGNTKGGWGLGGTNGTGQIPLIPGLRDLIDPDTPLEAHTWTHPLTDESFHLVFSDEFEVEGRTFWPGDDPFWEASDLHYHATGDFEWYSPEAVNTSSGFLNLVMEEVENHNLNFRSGMIQSWNKLCFQGGYIEMSAILPGSPDMEGFWPGLWTMGNLGRAGYLGTTQGMWPYSYNECDTGTLPNQTWVNQTGPYHTIHAQGQYSDQVGNKLSFLEGMRMSSCTCPGEDHAGPSENVGRAAPEIDLVEAQAWGGHGGASQSLQIAPFDRDYIWINTSDAATLHQDSSTFNSYRGNVYQEAVSGVAPIPGDGYEQSGGRPIKFAIEYEPDWKGDGSGHITWFIDEKPTWTVTGKALPPNPDTEIGQRLIPREPMYMVLNLAISDSFQKVNWGTMKFPATLKVDHVRVYQKDGGKDRVSCDPPDHPTAKYIQDHLDVYTNVNLTTFPTDKYPWPKNSLVAGC